MSTLRDRLRAQLADCKMPGALEAVDDILRRIDAGELSAGPAMEALLGSHIALRNQRRLQTAMRCARLPSVKTLDDFDFTFQPSVKRDQLESLHRLPPHFTDGGSALLPAHEPTLRTRVDGAHQQQVLRGMGRRLRRRGDGRGADRPPGPPLPHRQHPGQQLPHARTPGARVPLGPSCSAAGPRKHQPPPPPTTPGGLISPGSSPAQSVQFLLVKVCNSYWC